MAAEHPSRWEYRFDNSPRALALLREAAEEDPSGLSDLEREGLVQRFVIRAAFTARMIDAADDWIDMLTDRNRMSHEYDFAVFEEVANSVHVRYLGLFEAVYDRLAESRTSQ